MITGFEWLNMVQTPDLTKKEMIEKLGAEHSLALDIEVANQIITYEEYRVTRSSQVDHQ